MNNICSTFPSDPARQILLKLTDVSFEYCSTNKKGWRFWNTVEVLLGLQSQKEPVRTAGAGFFTDPMPFPSANQQCESKVHQHVKCSLVKLAGFGGGRSDVSCGDVHVGQNSPASRRAVGARLMTSPGHHALVAARTSRLDALRFVAVQRTMSLQLSTCTRRFCDANAIAKHSICVTPINVLCRKTAGSANDDASPITHCPNKMCRFLYRNVL